MPYDVFISYRRITGANDARLLQQALKVRGYEVFFDYDSVRDGQFDERIFDAIDEAPVFVLMMTEGVLDRCAEEGDWVRREINRALDKGSRIILVAPSDQKWSFPTDMPPPLDRVKRIQVSKMDKESLFEESIDKIVAERLPQPRRELNPAGTLATEMRLLKVESARRVECPICGGKPPEEETFRCHGCGRDGICLRHRRRLNFLCCECAKKEKESRRKARNERREQRKAARTERKNQRREKRARRRAGKEAQARSEGANDQ